MLARLLHNKYYPNSDFLNAGAVRGSSWGRKGILQGKKILHSGIRWRIGDGQGVWIEGGSLDAIEAAFSTTEEELK